MQRRADGTTLAQLAILVPITLLSLAVVLAIAQSVFGLAFGWGITLAWLAAGLLVMHRPTERLLAARLFKLRKPTPQEFDYLAPIWKEIARRAEIDATNYELWIEKSDDINAFASAGHIVAVSERALRTLPPGQLAGVLAHELGHHMGGHSWAAVLTVWYSLPARLVYHLARLVIAALGYVVARTRSCFLGVILLSVLTVAAVYAIVFLPVIVGPYLLAWLGRRSELRADRKAAELGFAPTLIAVLRDYDQDEDQETTGGLLATHPSPAKRIQRLEAAMRPAAV
ncbi:M48 family metalloprotease [Streptomyces sp. 7-21]|uniref:M48 family metalloprotease n=1 Tax=Streptomyces sp. 7-21 TaxID=2802283 RepID=UPI00191F5DE9|nr:M48 family metalloprotease [Streptomyces sp. 7-21]MBL1067749.1 M48 family metalloprotease [Streptomyces sp. 7-21]